METIERILEILNSLDGFGIIVTDEELIVATLENLGVEHGEKDDTD